MTMNRTGDRLWCLIAMERGKKKLLHHIHFKDGEHLDMEQLKYHYRQIGLHVLTQRKCFRPIEKPIQWKK